MYSSFQFHSLEYHKSVFGWITHRQSNIGSTAQVIDSNCTRWSYSQKKKKEEEEEEEKEEENEKEVAKDEEEEEGKEEQKKD